MSLLTLFLCPGISTLIAKGVYDAAFPLHDVSVRFERPIAICRKRPEIEKCHASPRPFCFGNTVGSRSRHAQFHHLCPEKPIAPLALDVLSKFFSFFLFSFVFPPQGDFAVVGHVEEKNDRQVGPSHTNMLISNHFSGPAYWSLFMWTLKADWWPFLSKCLSALRADIYQGNLNYSKQCWSLCLSFLTPPLPSAVLRHRLQYKSSKQF